MHFRLIKLHGFVRSTSLLLATVISGCGSDRIVSVDVGSASTRVEARVGDLVNIHLWAGPGGLFENAPTVSTPSVEFVDESLETGSGGFPSPGGPGQLFRFRAVSTGTALITFTPLQQAHVIVDTVVVR